MSTARPAAVAGLFYPAARPALQRFVAQALDEAAACERDAPRTTRSPKMLIVPHAGYAYSGAVAARAYARLGPAAASAIRRVVLLGPTHYVALRGLAASGAPAFRTPMGDVDLDREALAALEGLPQLTYNERAHAREHSLEVQLPFLQALLGHFGLVPLVVGDAGGQAVAQVLELLWGDEQTLVVISTDLSHYLPYAQAQAADRATAQRILALDAGLSPHEACGCAAVNGALLAARHHGLVPRLIDLRNSGDTASGDGTRVVGYGAFAFEPA